MYIAGSGQKHELIILCSHVHSLLSIRSCVVLFPCGLGMGPRKVLIIFSYEFIILSVCRWQTYHSTEDVCTWHHADKPQPSQNWVFIAAGILVLHTRVAVMSCSGNIHCHAGTSNHSLARRTHCLISFWVCYGSKPVLRISWANVKKEQMGMWKLVLCESKWFGLLRKNLCTC